jgi:hypothetical protein
MFIGASLSTMSLRRYFISFTLSACCWSVLALADNKKAAISDPNGSNDRIDVTATLLLDKEEIKQALGLELPAGVVAVRVKVRPLDTPVRIDIDDFALISHKDGQRSGPYAPSQLAGNSSMMIKTQTTSVGTGPMTRNTGPVWGGIPGTMGAPRQMPGNGGVVGNGGSGAGEVASGVEAKEGQKDKENPLLNALKEKGFKSEEIKESTTGLLYFPLEGKHKPKDLSMSFKGVGGRIVLNFGK